MYITDYGFVRPLEDASPKILREGPIFSVIYKCFLTQYRVDICRRSNYIRSRKTIFFLAQGKRIKDTILKRLITFS